MTARITNFHTLLLFPPVWTPATPYLALPVLTGFLKKHGLDVSQFDASLDYFISYLFTPSTMIRYRSNLEDLLHAGSLTNFSPTEKNLAATLKRDNHFYELLRDPHKVLNQFRTEESFFNPRASAKAQKDIYTLLQLVSLIHHPLRMTFNKYFHGIDSFPEMISHCDDAKHNLFLSYYESAVPERLKPTTRLVGISISTAQQLVGGLTLARWIKRAFPSIHVTLGGKHLLRLKEAFVREPEYLEHFCDSLVIDNGEGPLLSLIAAIHNNTGLKGVPNLVYTENGSLHQNDLQPREPLDLIPTPDFSDLPLDKYLSPSPLIPLRVSEGCYWGKCSFCARYYQTGFSTTPPHLVVDQLSEIQQKYGAKDFTINDDCLTPRYLEELSRLIVDRGLNISLSLWCKPVHNVYQEAITVDV